MRGSISVKGFSGLSLWYLSSTAAKAVKDLLVGLRHLVAPQRGPEPVKDPGLEVDKRAHDVERQRVEVA